MTTSFERLLGLTNQRKKESIRLVEKNDIHVVEAPSQPRTMATANRMGWTHPEVSGLSCSCWDLNVQTNTIVEVFAKQEACVHGWIAKVHGVGGDAVTRPLKPKVAANT